MHHCHADRIISPEAPLALRLSGQLMLGVVRIYYKQVEYLEHDAQGALVKLRQVGLEMFLPDVLLRTGSTTAFDAQFWPDRQPTGHRMTGEP
jgi:N terminus of Rad21 / Rec8 like protein